MTAPRYKVCAGCDKRKPEGLFVLEVRMGSRMRSKFCTVCYPYREHLAKKDCKRCKGTFPLTEFGTDPGGTGHKDFYCSPCRVEINERREARRKM